MTGPAIVTVTAAGAIDVTYRVAAVPLGGFSRARSSGRELSGKGVNLSAALSRAGIATTAIVVLGEDDLTFATHSEHAAILRPVTVAGATRVNTSILDDAGATTKINAPTPTLSTDTWERVVSETVHALDHQHTRWLVLCGALPDIDDHTPDTALEPLLRAAQARRISVAVDTSGPALAMATAEGSSVSLIKPNTHELAELTTSTLTTIGDVISAARGILARGVGVVFVSMGADGALVVSEDVVVHAHARPRAIVNSAGAGDASLAGFLAGLGDREPGSAAFRECLADSIGQAAAWGAHAIAQGSTILSDVDSLPFPTVIVDPDPLRPLREPGFGERS